MAQNFDCKRAPRSYNPKSHIVKDAAGNRYRVTGVLPNIKELSDDEIEELVEAGEMVEAL